MKTQTNNSLFTDIELDKAANVNGGSWSPSDFDFSSAFGGYASSSAFYAQLSMHNQYGSSYHLPTSTWYRDLIWTSYPWNI